MAWTAPMTFVAGNVLTAAQMNTHVRDNGKASMGADKASVRLFNTTVQAIPTATLTSITFDSERWDSQAMHSLVSNTNRITIPTNWSGQYIIGAHIAWASNNSTKGVFIYLNATYYITGQTMSDNGQLNASCNPNTLYGVVAGDYLEVQVWQNSGGNLNTFVGTLLSPEFYAVWNGTG